MVATHAVGIQLNADAYFGFVSLTEDEQKEVHNGVKSEFNAVYSGLVEATAEDPLLDERNGTIWYNVEQKVQQQPIGPIITLFRAAGVFLAAQLPKALSALGRAITNPKIVAWIAGGYVVNKAIDYASNQTAFEVTKYTDASKAIDDGVASGTISTEKAIEAKLNLQKAFPSDTSWVDKLLKLAPWIIGGIVAVAAIGLIGKFVGRDK